MQHSDMISESSHPLMHTSNVCLFSLLDGLRHGPVTTEELQGPKGRAAATRVADEGKTEQDLGEMLHIKAL